MTISAARDERRGVGLLAFVSIGILLASLMIGAHASPAAAVDQSADCLRPLDIVMVIDRSGSMAEVTGTQSRLQWAKDAANNLVNGLDAQGGVGGSGLHQVGLSTYGNDTTTRNIQLGSSGAAAIHAAINGPTPNGNTPLRQGMAEGADNMADGDRVAVDGVAVLHVLIFLSDGRPNPDSLAPGSRPSASDIAAYLAAADQTYGIAIGPAGQGNATTAPDLALMNAISSPPGSSNGSGDFVGGNYRHVVDAASLPNLFASIKDELLCGDIQIEKTPDPAGPVDAGTSVTYSYAVTNDGQTPLKNVVVTDDFCSPVGYVSGDDGDSLLEHGETWNYSCSMDLDQTTTNTACAAGDFIGGGHDSACADVTVEVNPPKQPAIKIEKSADATGTVLPGALVTYTYKVTNTGDTGLSNLEVTDLISGTSNVACDVDSSDYSGDDNHNAILDVGETWTFTCSTALQVTTSNEACVVADVGDRAPQLLADLAPAQTVEDCDEEKVEVSQSPSPSQSAEQSVEAGTGTPQESQPDTAANVLSGGSLPTIVFTFVLIGSLTGLALTNVWALRRGR